MNNANNTVDGHQVLAEIKHTINELIRLRQELLLSLAKEKNKMEKNNKNNHGKFLPAPYGNYSITEDGDCYSHIGGKVEQLTPVRNSTPYLNYNLSVGGKKHYKPVHQLVALAYLGARPKDMVIRHLDSNPLNNHVTNLAYGTQSENMQDAIAFGTMKTGEKCRMAKLSNDDVKHMRWMKSAGFTYSEIAKHYPEVKYGTVWQAVKGKTFKNI